MHSVNYVNRGNAEMILGTVWAHPKNERLDLKQNRMDTDRRVYF